MNVNLSFQGVRAAAYIPSRLKVSQIVNDILKKEKARVRGDINVIFVDNKVIRSINKKFLGEKGETDVIAFPYESDETFGDVFISIPVAQANAKRFGQTPRTEIVRLLVHGVLHLLGYDDHRPKDYQAMWKRQEELVARYAL